LGKRNSKGLRELDASVKGRGGKEGIPSPSPLKIRAGGKKLNTNSIGGIGLSRRQKRSELSLGMEVVNPTIRVKNSHGEEKGET